MKNINKFKRSLILVIATSLVFIVPAVFAFVPTELVKADHDSDHTFSQQCESTGGEVRVAERGNLVCECPDGQNYLSGQGCTTISGGTETPPPPEFGVECEGHDPGSGCCNGVRVSIGVDCEQNENPVLGYLAGILNFLAGGVIVVVTGMLVVGGVQYITSGGVPQKLEAARKRITDALIALIVFIFLYAILQWLIPGGLFGGGGNSQDAPPPIVPGEPS